MQEVTCFNCRNVVRITPDSARCPVCGEDLRSRLSSRYVASYFCQRAVQIAAADSPEAGLAEAERGLVYEESSDLRLLGAILAEQLQRYDLMRKMAAAIPVGDSLRKEAEWLLRAHQDRQAALREAALQDRATQAHTSQAGRSFVSELLGPPAEPVAPASRRGVLPAVVLTAVILVALGAGRWWWQSNGQATTIEADSAPVGATQVDGAPAAVATVQNTPLPDARAGEEPAAPALPIPTAETPGDLVAVPTEDDQVAQNTPPRAVVISADAFDLKTYLREVGRPDLALLPVRAQMQDGKLVLRGMVTLDLHRRELLATVAQAPGIDDINAVDLLLRPQPTYTVQEGDTLWTIVYDIYGNVDRLDEFFEYNRDVLPSPDAVSVGLVLKVPPQE